MKKILILLLIVTYGIGNTYAITNYESKKINAFITSPSLSEIESIKDKTLRVCERVFLEAFMRRDFTENENKLCSDIFEVKIEEQLTYIKVVMGNRGVY